jgi:hypothetical protein
MEKIIQLIHEVFETHSKLCLLLGVLLFVFGASGGVTYNGFAPVSQEWARLSLMGGGILLAAASFLKIDDHKELGPKEISRLGIKIISPQINERIKGTVRVTVTSDKPLPKGYELHVLRGYPRKNGIVPNAKAQKTADKLEWIAHEFDIAGVNDDVRTIEVWLLGEGGKALIENWEKNHNVVVNANRELEKLGKNKVAWLDPITRMTPDMHRCQSIVVVKGE